MDLASIKAIVERAVKAEFGVAGFAAEVDYADDKFGDFATNAPFQLAGQLRQPPAEIAARLAAGIKDPIVTAATAAGGYVNITLADAVWIAELAKIDFKYGSSAAGRGQKVQVEFISANPTGPLTLGNARGGFIGDVVARVLQHGGYDVTREYYFNDAGTQIGKLVESVKAAAGLITVDEPQYRGDYIQELADEFKAELASGSAAELGKLLTRRIFERFLEPSIAKMGIKFDVYFNEGELLGEAFAAAVERLRAAGLYAKADGAKWVKTSLLGDERDRPIVKSNGDVTYLGTDIAYHLNIFEQRGFDLAIKEWGADHAGQVPSLKLTLQKLLPGKKLDFIIHQFVRLISGGQEVKMSKRAGSYVTTDELIEQVGADVARFFFLMRSADSHMDFDLDLAREESQKNPYWYVMYSYVRANSILSQAKGRGLHPAEQMPSLDPLERQLVKAMAQLPALLQQMQHDYGVHRLTFYGLEIAKLFHDYYEGGRIIDLDKAEAEGKLYLIQQYRNFMQVYFGLLRIRPIEKM